MSRGLGRVQRACVAALEAAEWPISSLEIAGQVFGTELVSPAQDVATRRALRSLAKNGLVVGMGRGWRYGATHWASPATAKRYAERYEATFGKEAAER